MNTNDSITISKARYNYLIRSEAHLNELEMRGVENWEGYVGSMFRCNQCDAEYEWYEVEYSCPNCDHDLEY